MIDVGNIDDDPVNWNWMRQFNKPAIKAAKPTAAGIAVVAADSGRLLMLQRATTDDDPAAGLWEFPGGRLEDGESTLDAARREWQEETGVELPDGKMAGSYTSDNGIYQTFIYQVPSETVVPIFTERGQVVNPDDPDGDHTEALAWWDQEHLDGNPAVRPEVLGGLDELRSGISRVKTISPAVLKVAETMHKAGNTAALRDWYASGAGGQIQWGGAGDLTACHAIASRHMSSSQAWGFCQERHIQATGKPNPRD
jgi:8-oxo-dGTP pyrophosphatase MutT (NUDIX family)